MGACGIERLFLDGSSDDADVGDAGLFDRIHHGSEGSEGNALVSAEIDDALCGITFAGGAETRGKLVDVDGLVLQKDVLLAVDGYDHALLGDLVDRTRLRD